MLARVVLKERAKFKKLVVITGTPGVGKTTVSQKLAARLGATNINLADLVKREKLTSGYDRKRRTWIADMDKLAHRLKQILMQQTNVVIDGHYAPAVVPRDQVKKAFVLRCHPQQLKEQLQRRGFIGAKLWENLASEILDVCLNDAIMSIGNEKVCEIDTTTKTVDNIVNEILEILEGRRPCIVGFTDWLGTLEKEHKLDQYLEHF